MGELSLQQVKWIGNCIGQVVKETSSVIHKLDKIIGL